MSKSLYTTKEVAEVRAELLEEQGGLCKLTGLKISPANAVTDHNHKTQYVRAVLHRQANAVLGKIENLWARYLSFWYNGSLSDFLRQCADYIELPDNHKYVHPGWISRVTIDFKSLPEKQKAKVLHSLGQADGSNAAQRLSKFNSVIKSRKFTYQQISKLIKDNA